MNALKNAKIPFEYENIDNKVVADALHTRMNDAGIDTGYYLLPVIDVNNYISVRPKMGRIIETYNKF